MNKTNEIYTDLREILVNEWQSRTAYGKLWYPVWLLMSVLWWMSFLMFFALAWWVFTLIEAVDTPKGVKPAIYKQEGRE